jgi:hypothetical protein
MKTFCSSLRGHPLDPDLENRLRKQIQTAVKRKPLQPYQLLEPFLHTMRETAKVSDGYVGTRILITTLPRKCVPIISPSMWFDEPSPAKYIDIEISRYYPDPADSMPGSQQFHPAFIAPEFNATGFISVFGTELPPREDLEELG